MKATWNKESFKELNSAILKAKNNAVHLENIQRVKMLDNTIFIEHLPWFLRLFKSKDTYCGKDILSWTEDDFNLSNIQCVIKDINSIYSKLIYAMDTSASSITLNNDEINLIKKYSKENN